MATPQSAVPPFIPGLLIVSLLIIVSILIGWRNYLRRGNPRTDPVVRRWNWEGLRLGQENDRVRAEKPQMWEVGVSKMNNPAGMKLGEGWEKIMPLSATALDPDPFPPGEIEDCKEAPDPPEEARIPRFPDFRFLPSPSRKTKQQPKPQSPPPPPLPAPGFHRLQLSVIISMPAPMPSISTRLRNESQSRIAEKHPFTEANDSLPQTNEDHRDEEEGALPEVALGVTVVPWLKEDGEFDSEEGKRLSSS